MRFRNFARVPTMALTNADIEHIAHLARLEITDAEIGDYAEKLSSIIDFVAQLGEFDTENVTPMAHPLDMSQRLRPDTVTEADQRDDFQRNATDVASGYYLVPKVIE